MSHKKVRKDPKIQISEIEIIRNIYAVSDVKTNDCHMYEYAQNLLIKKLFTDLRKIASLNEQT